MEQEIFLFLEGRGYYVHNIFVVVCSLIVVVFIDFI